MYSSHQSKWDRDRQREKEGEIKKTNKIKQNKQ